MIVLEEVDVNDRGCLIQLDIHFDDHHPIGFVGVVGGDHYGSVVGAGGQRIGSDGQTHFVRIYRVHNAKVLAHRKPTELSDGRSRHMIQGIGEHQCRLEIPHVQIRRKDNNADHLTIGVFRHQAVTIGVAGQQYTAGIQRWIGIVRI